MVEPNGYGSGRRSNDMTPPQLTNVVSVPHKRYLRTQVHSTKQLLDLGKAAWWHNVAMSCPITFYQIKWSLVPNMRHLTGIPKWLSVSL